MKRAAFAVPGDLDTPTGGYAYDKRIIAELARARLADRRDRSRQRVSRSGCGDARGRANENFRRCAEGQPIVLDGLAFGVMAEEAALLRDRNPLVALVHHPLALETGLDAETARGVARKRAGGARLHAGCDRHQRIDGGYSVP